MYKIGVLGASGFIGRNLCNYFFKKGFDFIAISRKPPLENYPFFKLKSFRELPEVKTIVYLSEGRNIASVETQGKKYIKDSIKNLSDVLQGTTRRIIYISSAAVYDDKQDSFLSCDSKALAQSVYAKSKLECEKVSLDRGGSVIRLSNIYGRGMSKNNVLSDMIKQFEDNKNRIEIRDSKPVRDYLHVDDLTNFFEKISFQEHNEVFNVGSGIGYSVRELYEFLGRIYHSNNTDLIETDPSSTKSRIVLNIKATKRTVGWYPKIGIFEGLTKTIKG